MRPLLNYFGGKFYAAPWIISHFPAHKIYVEVFGGAASVLICKTRSNREILNDLNDEIFNLYSVLRENPAPLIKKLNLTPHSRREYINAHENPASDPVERARQTIVKSFFGIGESIWNFSGFRFSKDSNTCVAKSFRNWVNDIDFLVDRLATVSIECLDWADIIKKYDSKDTLFYLDPPYMMQTRVKKSQYKNEFSDLEHEKLIDTIQNIKGFYILSGYDSKLYESLEVKKVAKTFQSQKHSFRTETLWLCPKTSKNQTQTDLFTF